MRFISLLVTGTRTPFCYRHVQARIMTQNARTKKYSLKFYTAPDNADGEKEYDLNLPVTSSMLSWVLTGYSRWEVDDNTNSDTESALVE
jgi:hypothetical protein